MSCFEAPATRANFASYLGNGGFFPLARERALKGEGYLQIQASLAFLSHVLIPGFSLTLNEQA